MAPRKILCPIVEAFAQHTEHGIMHAIGGAWLTMGGWVVATHMAVASGAGG